MSRKIRALGATILLLVANESASNVGAIEPVPASGPSAWWDPLGLFRGQTSPVPRREGEGLSSGYEGSVFGSSAYRSRISEYREGRGPGMPVDYSYDHLVDQQ